MQYHEHPRPWSELRQYLSPDEQIDCLNFAAQYGVDLAAVGEAAEGWYQEWRLQPATPSKTVVLLSD